MNALPAKHCFNISEWQRFSATGFFPPGYRAELIEGDIIDMSPIGPNHSSCVDWLNHYLGRKLPESVWLRIQNPVTLGDFSEPEPDLAIVYYHGYSYRQAHPGPLDIILLIEVADTTLHYDRTTKCPLYARFSIPEYWIVNVPDTCVEIYRNPQGSQYKDKHIMRGAERIRPLQLADIEIEVSKIFE